MLHRFANPTRFLKFANVIQPWVAGLTVILIVSGLYFALFNSPSDYQQGETVRIMYIHVPSAWMALFCYTILAITSGVALVWKHPLADLRARSTAPIGMTFTLLALVTGSLWGKPMWGIWWVWDARLTSVLILFFLYLGYIALNSAYDDPTKGARASAILALVGVVNIPIIKFSVDWWNTLHQPATISKFDRPSMDSSMIAPLLLMVVGFIAFYLVVLIIRLRSEIAARRIRNLRLAQVGNQDASS